MVFTYASLFPFLYSTFSLFHFFPIPSISQLSEGVSPWGCPRFTYYNATWNEAEIPGIIEQALFEVDNYLDYLYVSEGVPSISFGVVYGNDLIHYYGIGTTNLNDSSSTPTADSIYRIGSISKVWTTLMAFILRDKGTVNFDNPVYNYNSNFSITNPWGFDAIEQAGLRITLKHLASQVSGLPREAPCLNATDSATCYLENTNTILERLKNEFMLLHPTDTQASYSNLGFALLGNIVAEYNGLTFEEALTNYVIDPLGATHTGLYLNSDQEKYAATGYQDGIEQVYYDLGWEGPAGQIFSSINDLYLLMRQYFASIPSKYSLNDNSYKRVTDDVNFITYPTTFREMLRPVFINPDMETGFGSPWEMQSYDYGGIKKWIRSKGGNVYGFSSNFAMIPELRLGTIGLVNDATDGSLYTFGPLQILYKAFEAWSIGKEAEYTPNYPDSVDIYEGDYYYEGEYLFTVSLEKLVNSNWLMLYGFSSGIYGTLLQYENDNSGTTFIFYDTQTNAASCWSFTLTALDGATLVFDISSDGKSVVGVELIDNAYGELFTLGDDNNNDNNKKSQDNNQRKYYLERKEKRTYKIDYSKKNDENIDDGLIKLLRKSSPLRHERSKRERGHKREHNRRGNIGYNDRVSAKVPIGV